MNVVLGLVIAAACGAAIIGLLASLPPIPQEVIDILTQGMVWASSPTNLIPVDTVFRIVGLVISIEGTILVIGIVRWLWKRLTAQGGD